MKNVMFLPVYFVLILNSVPLLSAEELREDEWLGTYVGSTIPGYEIISMENVLLPSITFKISGSTEVKFLDDLAKSMFNAISKSRCQAYVNFRLNITGGNLEKSGTNVREELGSGLIGTAVGDCVTKVRKLSSASSGTTPVESLPTQ